MIENNDPNFVVIKNFTIEFGKNLFQMELDDFLEIKKYNEGKFLLGNKFIINESMYNRIKDHVRFIENTQLEESQSDELDNCGMVVKPYIKENFDYMIEDFKNNNKVDLIVVDQIFTEF